ncbi:MAG: FAD-dependent oxidoreductase [Lachnospiraceae bacterium]|nr:FAD-dependent oxidoreductase [Lachnospiraceae bacterium]
MPNIKVVSNSGAEATLKREAVAHINPQYCVNCGTCREVCPVEAVQEVQREICRVCPNCTDRPAQTFNTMHAFTTKQSCTTACPLGISPQGYVNLAKAGKPEKAYELVWSKNPLPSVCSQVCHHPCEQVCKRGVLVDEPIAIRGLKRYLSETVDYQPEKYSVLYEERIAVIGAGPAGLAAGHYLSQAGYEVTVFESSSEAGGMLKRGIPEFRLDRAAVDRDIAKLEAAGLHIELGVKVSKAMIEDLKKDYDAIIVAAGTPHSKELKIPNFRCDGVMTALDFMETVNTHAPVKRYPQQVFALNGEVVVIGGGSVAIDAARAALRCGASKVTAACLESGENIPCHSWELAEAKEEGVEILEGVSPIRYEGVGTALSGVTFAKVTSFEKDASGKISFTTDPEDTITLPASWAITAIGQYADDIYPEPDGKTVFYAGDISRSACSVIDAMASARKTAYDVDAILQGRHTKDAGLTHTIEAAPIEEKLYPFNRRKINRHEIPVLPADERVGSFDQVEQPFTREEAEDEMLRCLNCGYEVVDPEKCIGCGMCQKLCPKGGVITMIAKEN